MTTTASRGLAPSRRQLANGVVVTAKASPVMPAVTIHAQFEAGAVFDPDKGPGVAHFVSRMVDRGTTSRTGDEVAEFFDGRGVTLAISINRHVISIVCTCLTEDFDDVLAVVGDLAMHPTFPDEALALRRGEIVTMIRQDEDSPATVAMERLLRLLYPAHPYSLRPRGSVESVAAITRAALGRFHARRFAPETLSLVVVGDVDPEHAMDRAEQVFGAWRAAAPQATVLPAVVPRTSRQQTVVSMTDKAQADIAYGFTTIVRSDPAYYAYWLMNNILGQYALGGRLGESIRERQGLAYYTFSALDANVVAGPLTVRVGVNPSNVDRAIASIDAELTRMAAEGPTEREVAESKQYLIGSLPRTLETNAGIATFLQTVEFFDLGLEYDRRLPDLLGRVTRDEVFDAARRTLVPERACVVVAGSYAPAPP